MWEGGTVPIEIGTPNFTSHNVLGASVRSYKIWTFSILLGLSLLILLNFFIWKSFTEIILAPGELSGDYSRVGYITGSSYATKPPYNLPKKHIENHEFDGQQIDGLTLGDSFSNSCGGKTDQSYQDWIETICDARVLNVQKLPQKTYIETLDALLHSGYLEYVKPKWILLQVVERHAVEHLSKPQNLDQEISLAEILNIYKKLTYQNPPPPIGFLNVGNFKFLFYQFLYKMSDNAFFSKVYRRKLSRSLFSVKNSNELIFAYEEFAQLPEITEASIVKMNNNLNALAEKLQARGIRLYFMPVVDKYNLYGEDLVDNPYPRSIFFETLRTLDKRYAWIDTKKILREEIERGVMDIYYADDSHWSRKAPKKIFETFCFE